jgi:hypothetical protein
MPGHDDSFGCAPDAQLAEFGDIRPSGFRPAYLNISLSIRFRPHGDFVPGRGLQ